jgi:predicted aconitase with swiveling domain
MERLIIPGRPFIPGSASGLALVSREPLSFWGGYDWKTGEIIDRRHPLSGAIAKQRILAIPFTRGSSTTTAVLLEAIRAGTAPNAIITTATDFFFALASVVADELYHSPIPLVAVTESDFAKLQTGNHIEIDYDGVIVIRKRSGTPVRNKET